MHLTAAAAAALPAPDLKHFCEVLIYFRQLTTILYASHQALLCSVFSATDINESPSRILAAVFVAYFSVKSH